MPVVLKNRAYVSTATTGTGTITLGSPISGYQSFADAGVSNGDTIRYTIEDGANFEIGEGVYTASGTTLSRTPSESSNSGSAINLSGNARVFISATAEDLGGADLYAANESSPSAQPSATGTNAIAIGDRATASGNKSIALGWGQSQGLYSMSGPIGNYLNTYGAIADYSLAIGSEAKASGSYGVALGRSVVASGISSLSLGFGGTASATNAVAIGDSNTASHANAIVIGDSVQSTTTNEVSIGGTADTVRISESYTLPTSDGSAGTALVTDGSGALSFSSVGADLYDANPSSATDPTATGNNAIAIGNSVTATGVNSTSVGSLSDATADSASAFGPQTQATGTGATAIGWPAQASGSYSVAIGTNSGTSKSVSAGTASFAAMGSYASGTDSFAAVIANNTSSYGATGSKSIAIGQLSKATATNSIAIGDTAISTTANQISLGGTTDTVQISGAYTLPTSDGSAGTALVTDGSGALSFSAVGAALYDANESSPAAQPSATGANAIAIGDSATATSDDDVAIGLNANATALGSSPSLALGRDSNATSGGIAIGNFTDATGTYGTAIGTSADATATNASALGNDARGAGSDAVALGKSRASGSYSLAAAIANNTSSYGATGANSVAIGYLNIANDPNAVAIGKSNISSGSQTSIAIGQSNNVTGMRGVAIGSDNTVSGLIGHAYGANNTVSGQYAVAFNRDNDAASNYSFVSGYYADSHGVKGRFARGTGGLSLNGAKGDAQYGLLVLCCNTTNATQTALSTDTLTAGSDNQLVVQNNGAVSFHGTIVAKQAGSSNVAAWEVKGLMHNVTTATLVNSAITVIDNTPGWGLAMSADTTNDAVQFLVTGAASTNISWVATIHSSEVIRS